MDDVILASDVVMVARGDLGVEIGDPELVGIQKALIRRARQLNCSVITATQMMESMITNPMPTRAEVMDVANAVLDGTDAVMLSAGRPPPVSILRKPWPRWRACLGAEKSLASTSPNTVWTSSSTTWKKRLPCRRCMPPTTAKGITAIITMTESGRAADDFAHWSPVCRFSPSPATSAP